MVGAIAFWSAIPTLTDEIAKLLDLLLMLCCSTLFLITCPWYIKLILAGFVLLLPHTLRPPTLPTHP